MKGIPEGREKKNHHAIEDEMFLFGTVFPNREKGNILGDLSKRGDSYTISNWEYSLEKREREEGNQNPVSAIK